MNLGSRTDQVRLKEVEANRSQVRYGVVASLAPLTVYLGGSDVAVEARAISSHQLAVDEFVAVLHWRGDLLVLGVPEADPDDEAWVAPTLTNSWVNFGGGYENAGYYKDRHGIVHLRGLVKSGTTATAIFTLPTGYRPATYKIFPAASGTGYARLDVQTSGVVMMVAGSNAYLSLSNVQFRAA